MECRLKNDEKYYNIFKRIYYYFMPERKKNTRMGYVYLDGMNKDEVSNFFNYDVDFLLKRSNRGRLKNINEERGKYLCAYAKFLLDEYYAIRTNQEHNGADKDMIPIGLYVVRIGDRRYDVCCARDFFDRYEICDDYYNKLVFERKDIVGKIKDIEKDISRYHDDELLNCRGENEYSLLNEQLSIMKRYNEILKNRIINCEKFMSMDIEDNKLFIYNVLDSLLSRMKGFSYDINSNDKGMSKVSDDYSKLYKMMSDCYSKYLGPDMIYDEENKSYKIDIKSCSFDLREHIRLANEDDNLKV